MDKDRLRHKEAVTGEMELLGDATTFQIDLDQTVKARTLLRHPVRRDRLAVDDAARGREGEGVAV
jgi:hypothetical protein